MSDLKSAADKALSLAILWGIGALLGIASVVIVVESETGGWAFSGLALWGSIAASTYLYRYIKIRIYMSQYKRKYNLHYMPECHDDDLMERLERSLEKERE